MPTIQMISTILICSGIPILSWAIDHPGYISDVLSERGQVSEEVMILPLDNPMQATVVNEILTDKMAKDFSKEFRYQFGFTEFEQLEFTSNRVVESSDSARQLDFNDFLNKQEIFGDYIAKELAEYHLNAYLRGNRSTRQIYKVKEAISNINVSTKAGYKFNIRYRFTTDRVSIEMKRPGEKFHKSIDAKLSGEDTTLRLSYDLYKGVSVGTDLDIDNEIYSIRGSKSITPSLRTSIAVQSFTKEGAATPKQDRVLLGLSWND